MTILVVDDDDLSRDLFRLLLVREGYNVETAASGEDALHLYDNSADHAEVVLTDMQMPGLSGSALAERLRATSHPPRLLLAMSGSQPEADQLQGFDGFLLKPFAMDTLSAAIANEPGRVAATTLAATTDAVLNIEIYNKLKASMKPEKLEQLYALCMDDTARRVTSMRSYAVAGDDASYRSQAHAIKGGSGMVGATELQSIAASEENLGIAANHVATLDEIMAALERLKRMLVAQRNHL